MVKPTTHVDWLTAQVEGNLSFGTLTYKQWRTTPGRSVKLDRYIMSRQAQYLFLRLDRTVLGRSAKKGKNQIERLVFHEGNGDTKRYHTHYVLKLPQDFTSETISEAIAKLWCRSDWGRPVLDNKDCYDIDGLIKYLLKEGTESFDPMSSHFSQQTF